jgi:hypothetical protein
LGSPERRAAAERSIATGKPQATAPLVLAQDMDTQVPGVIVFKAVDPPSMPAGFLTMGLKIERLIGPALQAVSGPDTRIEVIDIGTPTEPHPPSILLSLGTEAALGPEGVIATRTTEFAGRLSARRLDANHLRAVIGHHHREMWSWQKHGQVHNLDARKLHAAVLLAIESRSVAGTERRSPAFRTGTSPTTRA